MKRIVRYNNAINLARLKNDRDQLSSMAARAKEALEVENLIVVVDRGYFNGPELLACAEAGITTYVPKPETSNSQAAGRFGKKDFHYVAKEESQHTDELTCTGLQHERVISILGHRALISAIQA